MLRVLSLGDLENSDTLNGNMGDVKENGFFKYVYRDVVLDFLWKWTASTWK